MRYTDPKLRELLAAEYALGTLRGRARERFQDLLREDLGLQQEVAFWESRLAPMTDQIPGRAPPDRVWTAIEARVGHSAAAAGKPVSAAAATAAPSTPATIRGGSDRAGFASWWDNLTLWRGLGAAMTLCTLVLAVVIGSGVERSPPSGQPDSRTAQAPATRAEPGMMAVLTDATAQPTMLVSWPMAPGRDGMVDLRVRIIMDHPTMDPSTSWELWLLPPEAGGQPRSIGLVGLESEQRLRVDAAMLPLLLQASGMALSNEPAGGSPTGKPSGPMIFKGPCFKT